MVGYSPQEPRSKGARMVKTPKPRVNRILNCEPSKNTERDWSIDSAKAASIHTPAAELPLSKDLRDDWWTIGDQGATGSCVGWGTADGVLRWHFVNAEKLDKTQALSVRFIWMAAKEMEAKETNGSLKRPTTFIEQDGTSLKAALDIARKFGVVTEDILPLKSPSGLLFVLPDKRDRDPEKIFYALASKLKIASYINLGPGIENWKAWIAHNGPILTRLEIDSTWDGATKTKGQLETYDEKHPHRGGHCVAVVGYTHDRFIIRNSWGTGWGDKGYAYASEQYALKAFTESYGVAL